MLAKISSLRRTSNKILPVLTLLSSRNTHPHPATIFITNNHQQTRHVALGISAVALSFTSLAVSYSASASCESADPNTKSLDQAHAEDYLYPWIQPFNTGTLQVSPLHELYYEECGNPYGKPVIMVHGGPGAGCSDNMRRYHDPRTYRIILLDQRGSGRSKPHASLEDNTTWHLVEDMEKLRCHLNIDKWQVFGGSWGSTLSISYAIKHPTQVTELVLRGIFHLRKQEIDFYYQHGANFIYPDRWEAYRDAIPEEERGNYLMAYHKRLSSDNPEVRIPAALAWTTWEKTTSNLIPPVSFPLVELLEK